MSENNSVKDNVRAYVLQAVYVDKEKIKDTLSKYLLFEKAPPSVIDKTTNWFSKRLPGLK